MEEKNKINSAQENDAEKIEQTVDKADSNHKLETKAENASVTEKPKPGKKTIAIIVAMGVCILGLGTALVFSNMDKNNDSTASVADSVEESSAGGQPVANVDDSSVADSSSKDDSTDSSDDEDEDGYVLVYSAGNGWDNGDIKMSGAEFQIKNNSDKGITSWTLVLEISDLDSCEGWNGTYKVDGNKLTITNAEYNGEIAVGGSVVIGCNVGTKSTLKVVSATLNGEACKVSAGKISQASNNSNANDSSSETADTSELLTRTENAVQGDDWLHTDGNKILDKDGKEVWLTGVNWFGYNTGTNTFDGLWNSELVSSVEGIADHGFNLIRVPISAELINSWAAGEYPQANYNNAYNTALNDMNSLEIFDYFIKLAEENGLKVMMDIHSAETDASGHMVNLWCTDSVSVNDYYSALEWMADRYKNNDTIIAYDLKNEPHGKPNEGDSSAIWNDSKDANNWKYVAETAASKVLAKNPNVLIMVEGTEIYPKDIKSNSNFSSTNSADYFFNWWGGNLRGVKDYPIDLGDYQDKLVYSPHDYGPAVYEQPWFEGGYDFDSLMEDCWEDNWFYIYEDDIAPLLIGEWGGYLTEPNLTWMTYLRQLIKENHINHTFWCYNANSGDTGGLVKDDFTTWDEDKYNFVKEVLWQENGKFVGLDHAIKLGDNGITLTSAKSLS